MSTKTPTEIIILAAGQGKRMRSKLPKVLHCIAGKPMLVHVIDSARELDVASIHVVIGHGAELVKSTIESPNIKWATQEQQLGTGHAVAQAMPNVDPNSIVLIAYGDVPLIRSSTMGALIAAANENTLALLTVFLDDPSNYGRIVREDNEICAIVEEKDASSQQLEIREVNTGILAVTAKKLNEWLPKLSADNAQNEYYLTEIIAMAVEDGMEVVAQHPRSIMEVEGANDRLQIAALERSYQQQQALRLMMGGATIADPDRIDVRGNITVGEDVFIDINCVFIGDVSIADDVSIGPNCVIENSSVGQGSNIKANCVLENAIVSTNCEIGPFARLRPGSVLNNKVKIGNFVEAKNTIFGEGSKANHLAYLGDSTLGESCNIGAGTITCNYDGANKYKTTLGNNVFVGSNSTLVAPIEIADGGFVGAGSTVTKNISIDQLAIGRGKQRNIDGWQKPVKG
ncbi:MAG: bifunctional UDP-N-acetylglucosamine pyrophosphorylase/glucosamine-1-phosphate N-acetyltransferase [Oceanicoccus sp.]